MSVETNPRYQGLESNFLGLSQNLMLSLGYAGHFFFFLSMLLKTVRPFQYLKRLVFKCMSLS